MSNSPQLRMDGSKSFATVHGERPNGDPMREVEFYQDGLPFNSSRILLAHLIEGDPALKALAASKLARQPKPKAVTRRAAVDDGDNPQDIPDDDETVEGDVNLEMWLTGEAKYIFAKVRDAISARYQRRVISIGDAVAFLVEEQRVVTLDRLALQFKGFVT